MAHAIDFRLQIMAAFSSKPVAPFITRCIIALEALNPCLCQQALQCAIERSGTEHNPATAHVLDIFEDRVSMPGLLRKAEQDEKNGFG
jgi:hypothetical protein